MASATAQLRPASPSSAVSPVSTPALASLAASEGLSSTTAATDATKTPPANSGRRRRRKKKAAGDGVLANISQTSYAMVRQVAEELGLAAPASPECWDVHLLWFDGGPPQDMFARLRPWQRLNHFPNTYEITRKDNLARNLNRLQRACGTEGMRFDFFPRSWILPAELQSFRKYAQTQRAAGRPKTFIYKPTNGARGVGIGLTRQPESVPTDEPLLVQEYLARPMLVEGFKFDLRLYVLVAACDPLRVFIHRDGLVRLSTQAYKAPTTRNLDQVTMHLTNYSINKHSDCFEQTDDEGTGSKRSYRWLLDTLAAAGHDTTALQQEIAQVIIKTLIVGLPYMYQGYDACQRHAAPNGAAAGPGESFRRAAASFATHTPQPSMCFEVLGFDIFLTQKLRPLIIEVNRAPSFTCDSGLDTEIKHDVLYASLRLQRMRAGDRVRTEARTRRHAQNRLFGNSGATTAAAGGSTKKADKASTTPVRKSGAAATTSKDGKGCERAEDGESDSGDAASDDDSPSAYARWHETRVGFEEGVRGGFSRIYPTQDSAQMEAYDDLIRRSFEAHAKATGSATAAAGSGSSGTARKHRSGSGRGSGAGSSTSGTRGVSSAARAPGGKGGQGQARPSMQQQQRAARLSQAVAMADAEFRHSAQLERVLGELQDWLAPDPGGNLGLGSVGAVARRSSLGRRGSTVADGGDGTLPGNSVDATIAEEGQDHSADIDNDTDENSERQGTAVESPRRSSVWPAERGGLLRITDVKQTWLTLRPQVAQWWLREVDARARRQLVDATQARVLALCARHWAPQDFGRTRLARLALMVFERLRWNRGQGLWNCFSLPDESWASLEPILSLPTSSSQQQLLCVRLVQVCKDALLAQFCVWMAARRNAEAAGGAAGGVPAVSSVAAGASRAQAAATSHHPSTVSPAGHGKAPRRVVSTQLLTFNL